MVFPTWIRCRISTLGSNFFFHFSLGDVDPGGSLSEVEGVSTSGSGGGSTSGSGGGSTSPSENARFLLKKKKI